MTTICQGNAPDFALPIYIVTGITTQARITSFLTPAQHNAGFYFLAEYNARLVAPRAVLSSSFSDPPASLFWMRQASPVSDDVLFAPVEVFSIPLLNFIVWPVAAHALYPKKLRNNCV
jgi:hypothetical protein